MTSRCSSRVVYPSSSRPAVLAIVGTRACTSSTATAVHRTNAVNAIRSRSTTSSTIVSWHATGLWLNMSFVGSSDFAFCVVPTVTAVGASACVLISSLRSITPISTYERGLVTFTYPILAHGFAAGKGRCSWLCPPWWDVLTGGTLLPSFGLCVFQGRGTWSPATSTGAPYLFSASAGHLSRVSCRLAERE